MRRFAGVLPHVIYEMLFPSECLRAVRALVWRFACMLADMIYHMILAGERLCAECTLEWCFTGMLPHMIDKMFLHMKQLKSFEYRDPAWTRTV